MRLSREAKKSAVIVAAALAISGNAQAAIWTGAGDGTWASAGNWSIDATVIGDTVPPAADGFASFDGVGSTVVVSAPQTISSMEFLQASSSWNVNGAGKLTLSSVDAAVDRAAKLTVADGAVVAVNAPFAFNSHWDGGRTQVAVGSGAALRFSNTISGTKWTEKTGAGLLDLQTTGGTGNLFANLSIVAGTVRFSGTSSPTDTNSVITVSSGATLDIQGANAGAKSLEIVAGGTVTSSSVIRRTLSTNYWQGSYTVLGDITGNLNVNWRGQTLILKGNHTYSGSTTIASGTKVFFDTENGAGTGAVSISDNGVIGGTGSVAGVVTFAADGTGDTNSYGAILRPTSATDPLSLGGISGAAGAALDLVNMTGLTPSLSYKIVTYGGSTISGFGTVLNPPATHELSFATPGEIWLRAIPEPASIAAAAGVAALALSRRRRM